IHSESNHTMSSRCVFWSIAAVVGAPAACVLIGDFSATQCETAADCEAVAPGQGLVCDPSTHLCSPRSAASAQASSSASSGSGAGGAGGSALCTTNEECTARNRDLPSICAPKSGKCVELRTEDCPLVYGDWLQPDVAVFGAFAYLDPSRPFSTPA